MIVLVCMIHFNAGWFVKIDRLDYIVRSQAQCSQEANKRSVGTGSVETYFVDSDSGRWGLEIRCGRDNRDCPDLRGKND